MNGSVGHYFSLTGTDTVVLSLWDIGRLRFVLLLPALLCLLNRAVKLTSLPHWWDQGRYCPTALMPMRWVHLKLCITLFSSAQPTPVPQKKFQQVQTDSHPS